MGWFDDVTSFIGKNKDWLKPVVQTGLGALKQSNTDKTQQAYLDYLKQAENQNYQDTLNQINYYNASGQADAQAAAAAAASRAAAARVTEAARQAAAKKANKTTQNTYKQLLALYAPYRQTADALLPQMTNTYQNSLGLQNALANFVNTPAQTAKLNASVPSWQVNVPLPDSVRIK